MERSSQGQRIPKKPSRSLMSEFDTNCPDLLKNTQLWFGGVIERPIDPQSRINPIAPSGRPIQEEAPTYICASPTLEPYQRIQIYNQQYWWRLLSILHETFPLVTRLFGYFDFNQTIGFPFLEVYRPHHWSLSFLGAELPYWITKHYTAEDKPLIYHSAQLDEAFNDLFFVKRMPPMDLKAYQKAHASGGLLNLKLYLQRTVRLFEFPYNLPRFREEFIEPEDGDYWMDRPFPELEGGKRFAYILYRDKENGICWHEIERGQYELLTQLEKGSSLNRLVTWLEQQDAPWAEEAVNNLSNWIQQWVLEGWLTHERPHKSRHCWPPL